MGRSCTAHLEEEIINCAKNEAVTIRIVKFPEQSCTHCGFPAKYDVNYYSKKVEP